ncbi:hypothetical protein C8N35_10694 [Breoghania corrubedonensis]|uniref:Uncharacterized protein n=1 Tax=Breoghania corrubedonensis TaxID=665038 RepID=A0A2T5V7K1_9HYPH|nr:YjhX family toxin [Breoghania corrubedonensis]PTW59710.1 hypothetical protein C8N35_10694 [Breoghania corrubedonensis]
MNISRYEQRALHVLALGGRIHHKRDMGEGGGRKVNEVICVTREGQVLSDCTLQVFQSLRRKRLIRSEGGKPYIITYRGRRAVRAQFDNKGA